MRSFFRWSLRCGGDVNELVQAAVARPASLVAAGYPASHFVHPLAVPVAHCATCHQPLPLADHRVVVSARFLLCKLRASRLAIGICCCARCRGRAEGMGLVWSLYLLLVIAGGNVCAVVAAVCLNPTPGLDLSYGFLCQVCWAIGCVVSVWLFGSIF